MQITIYHSIFLALFLLVAMFHLFLACLIMHLTTTSRQLTRRYFKHPHFTPAELCIFRHFPISVLRTFMFMGLCTHPHRGKRRKMTDIRDHVPRWYSRASTIITLSFLVCAAAFVVSLFIMGAWMWLDDNGYVGEVITLF
ncbi:MAG: hypothetical protein GXP21_05190 [Gammaproteobacteria bacterium]|nr:hypothetical protein [Gammaproteobacteria bacterium]